MGRRSEHGAVGSIGITPGFCMNRYAILEPPLHVQRVCRQTKGMSLDSSTSQSTVVTCSTQKP
eukprot:13075260-Heterocapsa_arctica.AAC.1